MVDAKIRKSYKTKGKRVVIAYIHPGQVSAYFLEGMLGLSFFDTLNERRIQTVLQDWSSANVSASRNKLTAKFLDDYDADWLLWIDADMAFSPDAVYRVMVNADPVKAPIVSGLCFGGDNGRLFPTIYVPSSSDVESMMSLRVADYPRDAMVPVLATGAAFLLVHRTALEKIRAREFNPAFPFFQESVWGDQPVGEDLAFCLRAQQCGLPVYVDTSVRIGHHKSTVFTEEMFDAQLAEHLPPSVKMEAPPALERCAVIVPVYRRPQNAALFMATLRASSGMVMAYPVIEADDIESIEAWENAGAQPVVVAPEDAHTFAEKVNVALEYLEDETWVLIVGDDVRFHPGWLDAALYAAGDRFDVVGTNDLGNPRVVRGEHATHILLRRRYIDEVGASWDGPGLIAHEGYGHWYVDDEIVTAAKQRDTWTAASTSVIEHLHPLWGKAVEDETYLAGQVTRFTDEVLFQSRLAENGGEFLA